MYFLATCRTEAIPIPTLLSGGKEDALLLAHLTGVTVLYDDSQRAFVMHADIQAKVFLAFGLAHAGLESIFQKIAENDACVDVGEVKGIVQAYGDGDADAMVAGNVGEVGDDRIDHGILAVAGRADRIQMT